MPSNSNVAPLKHGANGTSDVAVSLPRGQQEHLDRMVTNTFQSILSPQTMGEDENVDHLALLDLSHDLDEFFSVRARSVLNYNKLLRVNAARALYDNGMAVWEDLLANGFTPSANTYTALFTLCGAVENDRSEQGTRLGTLAPVLPRAERQLRVQRCFELLEDMRHRLVAPNANVFGALIDTCVRMRDHEAAYAAYEQMKKTAAEMFMSSDPVSATRHMMKLQASGLPFQWPPLMHTRQKRGQKGMPVVLADEHTALLRPNVVIFTSLIQSCLLTKPANLEQAWETWHELRTSGVEPDVIAYNLMMRVAAEDDNVERAIDLMNELREAHIMPTRHTYASLIYACTRRKDYYLQAFRYFDDCVAMGHQPNSHIFCSLLYACARNGDIANAQLLMNQMDKYNVTKSEVAYANYLAAVACSMRSHHIEVAPELFKSLIKARKAANKPKRGAMPVATTGPTGGALLSQQDRIALAESLLSEMMERQLPVTTRVANAVVCCYARALRLRTAVQRQTELFDQMGLAPDYFTYMALLRMYSRAGRIGNALSVVEQMKENGIAPDQETFRILLVLCRHLRQRAIGQSVLRDMRAHGFEPSAYDAKPFEDVWVSPKNVHGTDAPGYDAMHLYNLPNAVLSTEIKRGHARSQPKFFPTKRSPTKYALEEKQYTRIPSPLSTTALAGSDASAQIAPSDSHSTADSGSNKPPAQQQQ